ncbi:WD40 repeat domain-containing serine/threonine protein kinase [Streptomyces sp. NBC_00091]|uniref:WD40 repeat domain-containing serine/threonine protein kinase n=1 Tax=Streptomyces sp. NBC_00091 TaxID=2975648 RepID=UPI00224CCDFC|nr:serine/threonine-protein kinase [Streptomyces sp. NBC_00091]MCX5379926.1 serine/threonine-protein kinase [Streptomyces sp. NBC_00091]
MPSVTEFIGPGGTRSSTVEPLRPGDPRTVGPYRLEGRLGAGGMGQVFLGTSASGRRVAVKLIRPELAGTARFRERFAREAAAARQVGGFHTAQVVEADPAAEPPWLATAFVPGPTLQQLVDAGGPRDPAAVLRLGAGIAEGLAAIHRCGLVHRDLKPGNVIVAEDGPRIIDFGIAHEPGADAMTRTGSVIGTYAYMSPEQVRGEALSPAGDVFAFGSVLVFAATGRSPFDATTVPAIVHRVVSEPPRLDGLAAPLRELVGACLAKDPAQRPGMDEVLARLSVTGPGAVPPAAPAAPGAAFHALPTQPAAAPPAPPGPAGAPTAPAPAGALSRRTLLLGGVGAAAAAAAVPAYLFRDSWLGSGSEQDRTRPVARLEGHPQSLVALAFSPDGRTLAAGGSGGELWLWDTVTRRTITKFGGEPPRVFGLAFSPDGWTLVGSCQDGTLRRWDVRTRTALPALSGFETLSVPTPYSLAVSPDGAVLAAAGGGTLQLFDLTSGRRLKKIEAGEPSGVLFTPDGKGVATASRERVLLWDVDGGEQPRTFTDDSADSPFYRVLISPDGKTIGGAGPGVHLWDLATGRPTATLTSPHRRLEEAAYRPGHPMIAGGGFGLGPDDDVKDEARAATGGTVSLWDLKTGRVARTLTADLEESAGAPLLSALAFSPDGKTLAAAFSPSDSTIQLWQLA